MDFFDKGSNSISKKMNGNFRTCARFQSIPMSPPSRFISGSIKIFSRHYRQKLTFSRHFRKNTFSTSPKLPESEILIYFLSPILSIKIAQISLLPEEYNWGYRYKTTVKKMGLMVAAVWWWWYIQKLHIIFGGKFQNTCY